MTAVFAPKYFLIGNKLLSSFLVNLTSIILSQKRNSSMSAFSLRKSGHSKGKMASLTFDLFLNLSAFFRELLDFASCLLRLKFLALAFRRIPSLAAEGTLEDRALV